MEIIISSLLTRKLPGSFLLKFSKANVLEMSGEKQNKGEHIPCLSQCTAAQDDQSFELDKKKKDKNSYRGWTN